MQILFLSRKNFFLITIAILLILGIYLLAPNNNTENYTLTILGYNDLGMHCIQPDYSKFLILPPGNNLIVQIFKKTANSELLTEGIKVKYKINSQEDPSRYTNFWTYAKSYGYNVAKGVGLTGNTLEGYLKLDKTKRYWEASYVPVTSLKEGTGAASPYQTATITVIDEKNGQTLAQFDKLVVPVSPEMDCLNCHKDWSNILKSHDQLEKTTLLEDAEKNLLHRCNECHADPILDAPGKSGIPSLSLAMHAFHADKMGSSDVPTCYNCHPGLKTQCYRGVMKSYDIECEACHGNMAEIAESIQEGRIPWLQEPGCEKCHEAKYSVNSGQLYRNSYLLNSPNAEMNNLILCPTCHNGPHAEWPSLLEIDNLLPLTYQEEASYIKKCTVCHTDKKGKIHQ